MTMPCYLRRKRSSRSAIRPGAFSEPSRTTKTVGGPEAPRIFCRPHVSAGRSLPDHRQTWKPESSVHGLPARGRPAASPPLRGQEAGNKESHYLGVYGEGGDDPRKPIELVDGAGAEGQAALLD